MRGARAGGSLRARGWSMAENSVFNFPNVLATNQLFHQLMHHQSSMSPLAPQLLRSPRVLFERSLSCTVR